MFAIHDDTVSHEKVHKNIIDRYCVPSTHILNQADDRTEQVKEHTITFERLLSSNFTTNRSFVGGLMKNANRKLVHQ
jgi:hypothetical protein